MDGGLPAEGEICAQDLEQTPSHGAQVEPDTQQLYQKKKLPVKNTAVDLFAAFDDTGNRSQAFPHPSGHAVQGLGRKESEGACGESAENEMHKRGISQGTNDIPDQG